MKHKKDKASVSFPLEAKGINLAALTQSLALLLTAVSWEVYLKEVKRQARGKTGLNEEVRIALVLIFKCSAQLSGLFSSG